MNKLIENNEVPHLIISERKVFSSFIVICFFILTILSLLMILYADIIFRFWQSLLCLFFGIIMCILSKIYFKSYFSPLGVYGFTWGIFLSLFYLQLVPCPKLDYTTKIAVFGSYFYFCIACVTTGIFLSLKNNSNCELYSTEYKRKAKIIYWKNTRVLKLLIFVTSIGGMIGALKISIAVFNHFGLIGMLSGVARYEIHTNLFETSPFWGLIFSLTFVGSILSGHYLAIKDRRFLFCYLPLFSALIYSFNTMSRSILMIILLLYFFSYVLSKNLKISFAHQAKYIIFGIVSLCILIGIFIYSWALRVGPEYAFKMGNKYQIPPAMYDIYSRVYSIAMLDHLITNYNENHWWGLNILYPVFRQMERINIIDTTGLLPGGKFETVSVPFRLNTPTFLMAFYRDFGLIGTLIIPYFLGVLSTLLYKDIKKKITLVKLFVLCFLYILFVVSPMGYIFYKTTFFFSFAIGLLLISTEKALRIVAKNSNSMFL